MARRSKHSSSPKVTRFFKPIIGENCDKFMLLPPFFARKMEHLANREAEIEDCTGQRWPVTYSYVNNCLAFEKGWQKFYIDHDLKERQLLVFKYIEGSHLVVHIFETTAGERMNFDSGGAPRKKRSRREEPEQDMDGNRDTCFVSGSECHNYDSHAQRVSTCIDEEDVLNCMINRDRGIYRGEDRSFLCDLNNFENISTNTAPSHTQIIEHSENLYTETVPSTTENTNQTNQSSGDFVDVAHAKPSDKGSLSKDMSEDVSKLRNGKCRRSIEDVDGRPKESFGRKRTRRRKSDEMVHPRVEPATIDPFSVEVKSLSYLELPADIPSIPGIKGKGQGKVVYLRADPGRLWPALYPKISCARVLTTNWRAFCSKHNIKLGDKCRFQAENSSRRICWVDVMHKSSYVYGQV